MNNIIKLINSEISIGKIFSFVYNINILMFILNIYLFTVFFQEYSYINKYTLVLISVIHLQIFIFYKKIMQTDNIFYLLLVSVFLIFYSLRLTTLIIYPNSIMDQFRIENFAYSEMNNFLIYMNLFFLIAHIFFLKLSRSFVVKTPLNNLGNKINIIFYFSVFALCCSIFFNFYYLQVTDFGRIQNRSLSYLSILLNYQFPLIILFITFIMKISIKKSFVIVFTLIFFVLFISLIGSRSALVTVVILFGFSLLVVYGNFQLKISLLRTALFGIIIFFMYVTFNLGTYAREQFFSIKIPFSLKNMSLITIKYINFNFLNQDIEEDIKIQGGYIENRTSLIYSRVGFLDIASFTYNYEGVNDVYNGPNYVKSVIDNLLTPGFNVYDQLPTARMFRMKYQNVDLENIKQYYHTDMVTIFSELKILFGYLGIFMVPFILYSFIIIKQKIESNNLLEFTQYYWLVILYLLFFDLINSFGFDTFLINTVKTVIVGLLYFLIIELITKLTKVTICKQQL